MDRPTPISCIAGPGKTHAACRLRQHQRRRGEGSHDTMPVSCSLPSSARALLPSTAPRRHLCHPKLAHMSTSSPLLLPHLLHPTRSSQPFNCSLCLLRFFCCPCSSACSLPCDWLGCRPAALRMRPHVGWRASVPRPEQHSVNDLQGRAQIQGSATSTTKYKTHFASFMGNGCSTPASAIHGASSRQAAATPEYARLSMAGRHLLHTIGTRYGVLQCSFSSSSHPSWLFSREPLLYNTASCVVSSKNLLGMQHKENSNAMPVDQVEPQTPR